MKKISLWAKYNPMKARFIIGFCHLLLVSSAIILGVLLSLYVWHFPKLVLLILGNLFFIAYFFYPERGQKVGLFKHSYARQKMHDFILVALYPLILAFGIANISLTSSHFENSSKQATARFMVYKNPPVEGIHSTKSVKKKYREMRSHLKKSIKSNLRYIKQELKKEGEGGRALLTALIVVAGFGAIFLVLALSCGIACNGQEGLAWVVLILGTAAVIWLCVLGVKLVYKKQRAKKRELKRSSLN